MDVLLVVVIIVLGLDLATSAVAALIELARIWCECAK